MMATPSAEATCREVCARAGRQALFNKGFTLGALDRSEDELGVYEDVVARYGDATEPILRQAVEMARTALSQRGSD